METMISNSVDFHSVWLEESHPVLSTSGSPVSTYTDPSLFQFCPSPAPLPPPPPATKASQSKKKGADHISRPPNAFLLFRSDFWALEKQKPRPVERDHRDISRIAAHCWRKLNADTKQVYYDKAHHLRELHKLQYPDYRLKPAPRRPRVPKRKSSVTLAAEERCRRLASSLMETGVPRRDSAAPPLMHSSSRYAHQGHAFVNHSPSMVNNIPSSSHPIENHTITLMNTETCGFADSTIHASTHPSSNTNIFDLQLLQPLITYEHSQVTLLFDGANSIPPLPMSEENYSSTAQVWSMPFRDAELQCSPADVQCWSEMAVNGSIHSNAEDSFNDCFTQYF